MDFHFFSQCTFIWCKLFANFVQKEVKSPLTQICWIFLYIYKRFKIIIIEFSIFYSVPRSVLKSLQQNTFCDLKCWQIINVKDKLDLFLFCRKLRHTACLLSLFYINQNKTKSLVVVRSAKVAALDLNPASLTMYVWSGVVV